MQVIFMHARYQKYIVLKAIQKVDSNFFCAYTLRFNCSLMYIHDSQHVILFMQRILRKDVKKISLSLNYFVPGQLQSV